jgi:ribose 5-phosphate isomerase A
VFDHEQAKRAAGEAAAALVTDGMTLGLGTGSTARWFIAAVGALIREGMHLQGVATSLVSEEQARQEGIPLVVLDDRGLDLAVDGADAIDPRLRMIKGAGGALVREKIVAAAARRFVVVADESKLCDQLGGVLPVEIVPFGSAATIALLRGLGARFELRRHPDSGLYISDNGNLIAQADFERIDDPEGLAERIQAIPGIVGHGLFLGMADMVLVARATGTVVELTPQQP